MSPEIRPEIRNQKKGATAAFRQSRWRCKTCAAEGVGGVKEMERHYLARHYVPPIQEKA